MPDAGEPAEYVWVCAGCKSQYPVREGDQATALIVTEDGRAPMPVRRWLCVCGSYCVLTPADPD